MSLPQIASADIPALAYAHDDSIAPAASTFRPVAGIGWVKPAPRTGLWAAPVTKRADDGTPADTAWLDWCRSEWSTDGYTHLTEVVPAADARVLRIDVQADLAAIVAEFPARSVAYSAGLRGCYPDWVALAEASWDAVFLTDGGQWATRLPQEGPDLYGWDCASVLWLRPAFVFGRTVAVPVESLRQEVAW